MMFTGIFVTFNWIYVQLNETDWKKNCSSLICKGNKNNFPSIFHLLGDVRVIFLNDKSCLKYQILGNKCGKIATFLLLGLNFWKNIKVEETEIYWTGCLDVALKYVKMS